MLKTTAVPLAAVAMLGLIGCPGEPPGPALDCEAQGYPCALADVPSDVLAQNDLLADELGDMLAGGASVADGLAWIQAQPGVVEAHADDTALRFRLNGARETWILTRAALAPDLPPANGGGAPKTVIPRQHVVGESAEVKRGLVLAPFKHQFGAFDDGAAVAQILSAARGYAGQVTYLENATKTAAQVGIQQFKGWDNYDVIHVTSHGKAICDQTSCAAVIFTGDVYSDAADLLQITEAGVNTARVAGDDARLFALSADFFRSNYPEGLVRSLVFFDACQTFGPRDASLAEALIGESSVFLGWTDVVQAAAATEAALAFYRNLADNGVAVQIASNDLGSLAINNHTHEGVAIESILLLLRPPGRDVRIREVVRLEAPDSGAALAAGGTVAAIGTAADGVVDSVPYQILVEGIPEDQQEAAVVQFSVEGFSSTPQTVSAGERVGETGWRLRGTIPYVDVAPSQTVQMRALLQLPEGGVSEQALSINLAAGEQPDDGDGDGDGDGGQVRELWTGEATSHLEIILGNDSMITIVAQATFEQTESSLGGATKRLRVTGGTMFWTRAGVVGPLDDLCPYSTSVEVPIEEGDAEILIDVATGGYTMHASTNGPEVRVAANCDDSFATRADGIWLPPITAAGQFFVSPNGRTITGQTTDNNRDWSWTFTRQR